MTKAKRLCGVGSPQLRQHFLAVEIDDALLVLLSRMDMDFGGASGKKIVQRLEMRLGIGADYPLFRHFFHRNFRIRAPLDLARVANIEVWIPGLGNEPPELRGV